MRIAAKALALLVALGAYGASLSPEGEASMGAHAEATTSILMTLEELVDRSSLAVVAEPIERTSRWEELAGGKRIVTYTRLVVHERIVGKRTNESAPAEIVVRTLGGTVDGIGQHVAGEATFTLKERSVVFVAPMNDALVVTGMAQGHYPLREESGEIRLRSSASPGNLLPRRGPSRSARERLVGATLGEARSAIVEAAKAMSK
jgi:hypothetical protein